MFILEAQYKDNYISSLFISVNRVIQSGVPVAILK